MFQSPLRWPNGWPITPWTQRKSDACFQCTSDVAVDDLYDELRKLHARGVVIASNLPLDVRGSPLFRESRTAHKEPGVALWFTRDDRPFVIAQDTFQTIFGNLRSIGLAIAALRKMERHGGGRLMSRAFEGFAALPGPTIVAVNWRELLGSGNRAQIEARYRELARKAHPDFGGSVDQMARLNEAIAAARRELPA